MSKPFKVAAWLCIVVSALSSMIISYAGLAGLARLVGYSTVKLPLLAVAIDVSALLPVAIDVAIVASTLVWLGQGAPAQTTHYARGLALVTIGTSVLANAVYHGLTGGAFWWLASIVASIPPAFLAALVHLGALLVRTGPPAPVEHHEPEQDRRDLVPVDQAPAMAHPDQVAPAPEPGDELVTSRNLVEEIEQMIRDAERVGARPPGRTVLARKLDVSEHEVRQALESLRQERAGQLVLSAPSWRERQA